MRVHWLVCRLCGRRIGKPGAARSEASRRRSRHLSHQLRGPVRLQAPSSLARKRDGESRPNGEGDSKWLWGLHLAGGTLEGAQDVRYRRVLYTVVYLVLFIDHFHLDHLAHLEGHTSRTKTEMGSSGTPHTGH